MPERDARRHVLAAELATRRDDGLGSVVPDEHLQRRVGSPGAARAYRAAIESAVPGRRSTTLQLLPTRTVAAAGEDVELDGVRVQLRSPRPTVCTATSPSGSPSTASSS